MANWKQILTSADVSGSLKVIDINQPDTGYSWATGNVTLGLDETLDIVAGTGITIMGDDSTNSIRITNSVTDSGNTQNEYATSWVDSTNDALLRLTESGAGSGTQDLKIVAGSNITLTPSGTDLTIAAGASSDTTYSTSFVDSSNDAILRLTAGGSGSGTDDLTFVAGAGITLTPSGDDLTVASTITQTTNSDINVNNANLLLKLAALESPGGNASDQTITIGADAGDTIKFTGHATIDGDLTVTGTTVSLKASVLEVADKIITLADADSPSASSGDNSGIEVMSNSSINATLKWATGTGDYGTVGAAARTGWQVTNKGSSANWGEICVQNVSTSAPTNSDDGQGVGTLWLKTDADGETPGATKLYLRVGDAEGSP